MHITFSFQCKRRKRSTMKGKRKILHKNSKSGNKPNIVETTDIWIVLHHAGLKRGKQWKCIHNMKTSFQTIHVILIFAALFSFYIIFNLRKTSFLQRFVFPSDRKCCTYFGIDDDVPCNGTINAKDIMPNLMHLQY